MALDAAQPARSHVGLDRRRGALCWRRSFRPWRTIERVALDGETVARKDAEERRAEAQQALAGEARQRQETERQQLGAEDNFRRAPAPWTNT